MFCENEEGACSCDYIGQDCGSSLIKQRDVALRELARFDAIDKGSRWLTHSVEGYRLLTTVRELDARIEAKEI